MQSKDKTPDPLYFIALLPPAEIASTITPIKEDMAENFNSKAALRSPPHITLHMPFRWPDKKMEEILLFLQQFAKTQHPFEVCLNNFGAFPPRVIYVAITPNEKLDGLQSELLKAMRKELNIFNGNYKQQGFHPHITVAFRDLRPANFKLAWEVYQYKSITSNFISDHLTLLKHNGQHWEILENFSFEGREP